MWGLVAVRPGCLPKANRFTYFAIVISLPVLSEQSCSSVCGCQCGWFVIIEFMQLFCHCFIISPLLSRMLYKLNKIVFCVIVRNVSLQKKLWISSLSANGGAYSAYREFLLLKRIHRIYYRTILRNYPYVHSLLHCRKFIFYHNKSTFYIRELLTFGVLDIINSSSVNMF